VQKVLFLHKASNSASHLAQLSSPSDPPQGLLLNTGKVRSCWRPVASLPAFPPYLFTPLLSFRKLLWGSLHKPVNLWAAV